MKLIDSKGAKALFFIKLAFQRWQKLILMGVGNGEKLWNYLP